MGQTLKYDQVRRSEAYSTSHPHPLLGSHNINYATWIMVHHLREKRKYLLFVASEIQRGHVSVGKHVIQILCDLIESIRHFPHRGQPPHILFKRQQMAEDPV